jgi:cell migration-inducing and hyaluronan-binding protein
MEGMNVMGIRPGHYLSAALLSTTVMLGVAPDVAAQEGHAHDHAEAEAPPPAAVVRTLRWSDPAVWPDGKVPAEGDAVTIARGTEVVLDVAPPALRSLTVDGKLTFSDQADLELMTDWIYLRGGELQIGT